MLAQATLWYCAWSQTLHFKRDTDNQNTCRRGAVGWRGDIKLSCVNGSSYKGFNLEETRRMRTDLKVSCQDGTNEWKLRGAGSGYVTPGGRVRLSGVAVPGTAGVPAETGRP